MKVTDNHNNYWLRVDRNKSKDWAGFKVNSALDVILSSFVSD